MSMHTSSTNLAAAISTSSTGTITSILHKRDLSTQRLPCPRNINTLHPRTRPLREKGCLCPSPTKPKTTTPLLTRFDSRVTLTGPSLYSNYTTKGISAQLILFLYLEKQAQVPGPHPGDHSHRPPPTSAWDPQIQTGSNSQTNTTKPNTITRR